MKDFVYQPTKFTKINQISNEKIDIESLTEKIAVFFTDIVGSTEFFKVYGDEHGKEMLHNHYNTASSIINRFNGHVIKFIGDSIMAYFKDPLDALRAAINLQHKIQMHNKQLMALPIRIRIGIHYGNVLVEKKDIYGDVVNVASKLTNMAEGDKIYISNELFNQVKNVPFVHFEMIDSSDKKNIPDGLIVYSVSWDEELILDKENIVFYLSPIPLPNGSAFYEFWENFIKHDDLYLKDRIKKISISKKDTLVFYLKDLSWMFDIARHIMDTLRKKVEDSKEMGIVPVYFLIDNVNDVKNDIALFEEFKKHINPGYIYISEDALIARGSIDVELIKKPPIISGSKKLYRLLYSVEDRRELEPFYFGHILTEGYHSPCFYCGSKKHSPGQCPTKNLPEITEAINKIAYLSTGHINRLFLSLSALKEFQAQGAIVSTVDNEQMIAYTAFFEPTRVFQLRFLRTIWNCSDIDWERAKNRNSANEGGLIWLAQDSLRISDYGNAEACLKKAIEDTPDNFRIYCIYGLLFIEKGDMKSAEVYLKKAVKYVKNKIHRDFLNLLLARLYYMENRLNDAWKVINDIIFQDPFCLDAQYLGIKIDFKMEKYSKAMAGLMDLINDSREYFMYAYMDSELFPYREKVTETLEKIFKKAKENAIEASRDAEKEFIDLRDVLDTQTSSDLEAVLVKIKNLIEQNSYFGYLDAFNLSQTIKLKIQHLLKEKREGIKIKLEKISERIGRGLKQIRDIKYKRLAHEHKGRLERFSEQIDTIFKSLAKASFGELLEMDALYKKLDTEMASIEEKLENLVFLDRILISFGAFTKYILFSSAIVFLLSIFLPFITHQMNTIFLKLGLSATIDEMDYKRYVFLWGGVLGFIFSIFASIRKFVKYPNFR